ncbi:MAG TPA: twin-arginine translocase subunit TatC [Candidatus Binatia bacterium]|nr:twin-arginine translocase subunit TatC [Candidatus Binatia bacterium]
MPFTSHLAELRSRLVKSVLAIAVVFIASFAFAEEIFAVLTEPLRRLNIRGLMLIGTAVTEAFFTKMKVSFVVGVILSSPIWLWQLWQFIAPGLYEHEKRYTRSFVSVGSVFFVAGAVFAYFVVIERGLGFLLARYEAIDIQPLLQIGDYLSLVSRLVLAFGIMFEMPVLAFFLARVGIVDHRFLIRHSRYAFIAIALFAAILTPPDLIAQVFMMVPLMVLYALSIAVAYAARYRMNRAQDRME